MIKYSLHKTLANQIKCDNLPLVAEHCLLSNAFNGTLDREKMLFHVRVSGGQQLIVLTDQRIMIVSAAAEAEGLAPESIRMAGAACVSVYGHESLC
eukprot:COSAG05_NODE_1852_length_3958_cov_1.907748_3_plen_96_part_00